MKTLVLSFPSLASKLMIFVLGISILASTIHAATIGDVNGDAAVNVFDALLVLQNAVGLYTPADITTFKIVADAAPLDAQGTPIGNGKVDVFDALAILRCAVNLDRWPAFTPNVIETKEVLKSISAAVTSGSKEQVMNQLEASARLQISNLDLAKPQAQEIAAALFNAKVTQTYATMVEYESTLGTETISFYMIKEEGTWKLAGF